MTIVKSWTPYHFSLGQSWRRGLFVSRNVGSINQMISVSTTSCNASWI